MPRSYDRYGIRPASGVPARGYRYSPFLAGNAIRKTHGAYHAATVDPIARQLVESLGEVEYIAGTPEFAASVWGWARAEAKVQLLSAYLDREGVLDGDGVPRPALDALHKFERLAAEARSRLGLDPASRARMGRSVAGASFDLARAWAEADDDGEPRHSAPARREEGDPLRPGEDTPPEPPR
jgi:hypothetical protein